MTRSGAPLVSIWEDLEHRLVELVVIARELRHGDEADWARRTLSRPRRQLGLAQATSGGVVEEAALQPDWRSYAGACLRSAMRAMWAGPWLWPAALGS